MNDPINDQNTNGQLTTNSPLTTAIEAQVTYAVKKNWTIVVHNNIEFPIFANAIQNIVIKVAHERKTLSPTATFWYRLGGHNPVTCLPFSLLIVSIINFIIWLTLIILKLPIVLYIRKSKIYIKESKSKKWL